MRGCLNHSTVISQDKMPAVYQSVCLGHSRQGSKQSNDEQVQAIATRNLSLVTDTTTSDHFQDIANSLQDLLNHQVTGISILQLDFGPVTVSSDGSSATATTFESWRINSTAGS